MTAKQVQDLEFSCTCGALQGVIKADGVQSGTRAVCFCPDCRAGELYFDQPDPAPGPVDIFQMAPDSLEIAKGREHLAAIRLGPKGMYRWYASCCNTPIATTMTSAKFPFAGFNVSRISNADKLGPVISKGFVPQSNGKRKHENLLPAVWGMLSRAIGSRLSGRWRINPFFDTETGRPVAPPKVLSKDERAALYD